MPGWFSSLENMAFTQPAPHEANVQTSVCWAGRAGPPVRNQSAVELAADFSNQHTQPSDL